MSNFYIPGNPKTTFSSPPADPRSGRWVRSATLGRGVPRGEALFGTNEGIRAHTCARGTVRPVQPNCAGPVLSIESSRHAKGRSRSRRARSGAFRRKRESQVGGGGGAGRAGGDGRRDARGIIEERRQGIGVRQRRLGSRCAALRR